MTVDPKDWSASYDAFMAAAGDGIVIEEEEEAAADNWFTDQIDASRGSGDDASGLPGSHAADAPPSPRPRWLPWRTWDTRARTWGPLHGPRRDRPDGGKEIPWPPGLDGHHLEDLIYVADGAPPPDGSAVILTEGEKSADAVAETGRLAFGTVCGASSVPGPDVIAFLARYQLTISPDNDPIGIRHMGAIAEALEQAGTSELSWIDPPAEAAAGWDLADVELEERRAIIGRARPLLGFNLPPEPPEFVSRERDGASARMNAGPVSLPFRTAAELAAVAPAIVEWFLFRWVAFGAITELDGKPKASGKTTFILALIRAALDELPFLGERTTKTPIVMLTEQTAATLAPALRRAGLADRSDLIILTWTDARGPAWPDVVQAAVAECSARNARVLIVDTLPQFAGLRGDTENDSGAALEAIAPLQAAAAAGLAVLVSRHDRKGPGEIGESARGSSAFAGAVDAILRLCRRPNSPRPTIRDLFALSRFEETPDQLVIELTPTGYISLGDGSAIALDEARQAIVDALTQSPDPLTVKALCEKGDLAERTCRDALAALMAAGQVGRTGAGVKGNPHLYSMLSDPANSFSRTLKGFAERNESTEGPDAPLWEDRRGDAEEPDLAGAGWVAHDSPPDAEPGATIACADYRAHQSRHRLTADGWTCDACRPEWSA